MNNHLGLLRSLLEDIATVEVFGDFVEVRVTTLEEVLRVGLDIGATADLCFLMGAIALINESTEGFVILYEVDLFDLSLEE